MRFTVTLEPLTLKLLTLAVAPDTAGWGVTATSETVTVTGNVTITLKILEVPPLRHSMPTFGPKSGRLILQLPALPWALLETALIFAPSSKAPISVPSPPVAFATDLSIVRL